MIGHDDENSDDNHNNSNERKIHKKESLPTSLRSAFLLIKKEKTGSIEEKLRVAITSIIASLSLTILKFVVGFSTNSLGILSESLHSGLDLVAAMMTLYAVRIMMRPRDLRYTYGYAKFESVSSLFQKYFYSQ